MRGSTEYTESPDKYKTAFVTQMRNVSRLIDSNEVALASYLSSTSVYIYENLFATKLENMKYEIYLEEKLN